jgi:hypothetical protein
VCGVWVLSGGGFVVGCAGSLVFVLFFVVGWLEYPHQVAHRFRLQCTPDRCHTVTVPDHRQR